MLRRTERIQTLICLLSRAYKSLPTKLLSAVDICQLINAAVERASVGHPLVLNLLVLD